MRTRQGRAKHQAGWGVATWLWLISSVATTVASIFSPPPCSVRTSFSVRAGPVAGCSYQARSSCHGGCRWQGRDSGQARWDWGADLFIRSTSMLAPLSPSSALPQMAFPEQRAVSMMLQKAKPSPSVREGHEGWWGGISSASASPSLAAVWTDAHPHAVSSPGNYLTAASPTPSFHLCRELRASPMCRLSGFWVLLAFPGISVTSCFKSGPPSPTPAIPFSLGAQGADSHHPSPCSSAWLLLSNRKSSLHVETCNIWERHGQFATEGVENPPEHSFQTNKVCFAQRQGCTENLADSLPWGSGLRWKQPGRLWHDIYHAVIKCFCITAVTSNDLISLPSFLQQGSSVRPAREQKTK